MVFGASQWPRVSTDPRSQRKENLLISIWYVAVPVPAMPGIPDNIQDYNISDSQRVSEEQDGNPGKHNLNSNAYGYVLQRPAHDAVYYDTWRCKLYRDYCRRASSVHNDES